MQNENAAQPGRNDQRENEKDAKKTIDKNWSFWMNEHYNSQWFFVFDLLLNIPRTTFELM